MTLKRDDPLWTVGEEARLRDNRNRTRGETLGAVKAALMARTKTPGEGNWEEGFVDALKVVDELIERWSAATRATHRV